MLTRVEIKGFRTCRDVALDNLGGMVVLVGTNGSGKTNILHAIRWAAEMASTGKGVPEIPLGELTIRLDVVVDETRFKYEFHSNNEGWETHAESHPPVQRPRLQIREGLWQRDAKSPIFKREGTTATVDGHDETLKLPWESSCLGAILARMPADHPTVKTVRPLVEHLERVRYYALVEPNELPEIGMIRESRYLESRGHRHGIDESQAAYATLLRLIDLQRGNPDTVEELNSLLGTNGLGLVSFRVEERDFSEPSIGDPNSTFYRVSFEPLDRNGNGAQGGPQLDYSQLSLGTRRIVEMLTAIFADDSSVLMLEHPEDGIHRGLLYKLIDILRVYSDQRQFIITTHSAAVLDCVKPASLRFVELKDGATVVRSLSERELNAAGQYLNDSGTLAEFVSLIGED